MYIYLLLDIMHPTERELTSDWFISSFIMIVYEKIILQSNQNFLSKTQLKKVLIETHYKTIYESVRS